MWTLLFKIIGQSLLPYLKPIGLLVGGALFENRRQASARQKRTLKLFRKKEKIRHEVQDLNTSELRGSDFI